MFTQNSILIESFEHICQDNLCQGSFTSTEGKTVWYGAVSDGCSSSVGSHYGAEFLVKQFARLVPKVYDCGSREQQLLHQIALGLCQSMAKYIPKDTKSGIEECGGLKIYGELAASLQGYVADETNVCLLLAGDGNIGINGVIAKISHGDGVVYPVNFLACPQQVWQDNIGKGFFSVVLSTTKVGSLLLSTDGFEEDGHDKLMDQPARLIRRIQKEATQPHLSSDPHWCHLGKQCEHRHDDTALLTLSRKDSKFKGASASQVVTSITKKANLYGHVSYPVGSKIVIQANDEGDYWDEQTNCRFNPKLTGFTVGVHTFLDGAAVDAVEFNYVPPSGKFASSPSVVMAPAVIVKTVATPDTPKAKSELGPNMQPTTESLKTPDLEEFSFNRETDNANTYFTLDRLCDYQWSTQPHMRDNQSPYYRPKPHKYDPEYVKYSFGLKACCVTLTKFHETITELHKLGVRLGNIRPQDVLVKLEPLSQAEAKAKADNGKPEDLFYPVGKGFLNVEIKFCNPEDWTITGTGSPRPYGNLDENYIHPKYLQGMRDGNDQDRLNQDWFSYYQLLCHVLTKGDPFGEGVVKNNPDADRKYRMGEGLMFDDKETIEIQDKSSREFFDVAIKRLGSDVKNLIDRTLIRHKFPRDLDVLKDLDVKLIRCRNKNRTGRVCGLQQHEERKKACLKCKQEIK